ncbi:Tvp15p SCDLUD_003542 [Saccharomycodes ludwigii]|uniref:Tvp15p n=1 Tax=Saccharomycodes ludwigii TaxID=36035 RepID=UPI001E84223C|nr:hypothetical protein SCDLUD_003542 [Saccharomycodes ludwigii]KAH3900552.1 hypothetical protein SCDLUD_003542 [Saccharomycodes ludwigii]
MSFTEHSNTIFKSLNVVVAGLTVLSTLLLQLFFGGFIGFILSLYVIIISTTIIFLEFKPIPALYKYASFYYSFIGRGFLHILLGFIKLNNRLKSGTIINILISILNIIVGLAYILLQFNTKIDPPNSFNTNTVTSIEDGIEEATSDDII